jgi:hypothetical protein
MQEVGVGVMSQTPPSVFAYSYDGTGNCTDSQKAIVCVDSNPASSRQPVLQTTAPHLRCQAHDGSAAVPHHIAEHQKNLQRGRSRQHPGSDLERSTSTSHVQLRCYPQYDHVLNVVNNVDMAKQRH